MRNSSPIIDKISKLLIFFSLILLACGYLFREIGIDSDIWLHLKTGWYILANHTIPTRDIFSFTVQGAPWLNHEWLTQILDYFVYFLMGANGIIILRTFVIGMALISLYKVMQKGNNYILSGLLLALFILISQNRFNDRPEMFTLLFLAAYIFILEKYRNTGFIWLIPLFQLLWVNMHGYFLLGVITVLSYLLGSLIAEKANRQHAVKRFFILLIFTTSACFINPDGIGGFIYPFKMVADIGNKSKIFTNYINELLPPFKIPSTVGMEYLFWYKALLFLSLFSFILNYKKLNKNIILIYFVTLIMSLGMIRNIPLFALMACIVISANFRNFKTIDNSIVNITKVLFSLVFFVFIGNLAFGELTSEYYVFSRDAFKSRLFGVSEVRYPHGAAEFLKINKVSGPILNNFYCGSYLVWKLYPEEKVFIDGRTEVYGPEHYKYYRQALENKYQLGQLLEKYGINCVLFFDPTKESDAATKYLYKSNDWRLVYFDELSYVFVKNSPANRNLISKFDLDLKDYRITRPKNIELLIKKEVDPYKYLKLGKLFLLIGMKDKGEEAAQIAYLINRKSVHSYNLLGIAYMMQNKYDEALQIFSEALSIGQKSAKLYYNMGIIYDLKGEIDKSIDSFKEAIEVDGKYLSARFGLALMYKKKGDTEKSEKALLALEGDDLSGDVNCQLGYIYLSKRDFENAEERFKKALDINSYHAMSYNGIGLAYANNKLPYRAIEQFKKAITIYPDFKEAHDNLGAAYANVGDYANARIEWEKVLEIDPSFIKAKKQLERLEKVESE